MAQPMLDANGVQMVQNGAPVFDVPAEYGIITVISTLSWGLGYFGMPQVLVRFMGIRSDEEVKQSRIIAIVWVVISMFCAVCIGLIGRYLAPDALLTQSAAESIFIVLSQMMLPSFLCGIVVSGILAASMSSASSYLLITGSSVAENIFRSLFKKDATDDQVLIVSRITLAAVLLFGIWVAWDENSVIFTVVSYAWAGLGASFGPLTLFALYWRRTTKQGAIAGMVAGAVTVLVWHNFVKPMGAVVGGLGGSILGMYELLPAFLIGCLAIFLVSKMTPEPEQAVLDTFDHYMDSTGAKRNVEAVLEENMASSLPETPATSYPEGRKK
jgi:sodium/proline symporter